MNAVTNTESHVESLSREEMTGKKGQSAVERILMAEYMAMRAVPQGRGVYKVEGLDNRGYQKFRSTKQLGAFYECFAVEPEARDYARVVTPLVQNHKHMVFVPVEGGVRVYHYQE